MIIASSGTGKTTLAKKLVNLGFNAADIDEAHPPEGQADYDQLKQLRKDMAWDEHNKVWWGEHVLPFLFERQPDIFLTHGLDFIEHIGHPKKLIHLKTTPGVTIRRVIQRMSQKKKTDQEAAVQIRLAATNYETNLDAVEEYNASPAIEDVDADVSPDAVLQQVEKLIQVEDT